MSNSQSVVQSSKDSGKIDKPPHECYVCVAKQTTWSNTTGNVRVKVIQQDKRQRKGKLLLQKLLNLSTNLILRTFLCSDSDSDGSNNVVRITDQGELT